MLSSPRIKYGFQAAYSSPDAAHLRGTCGGGFREGERYLVNVWEDFDEG